MSLFKSLNSSNKAEIIDCINDSKDNYITKSNIDYKYSLNNLEFNSNAFLNDNYELLNSNLIKLKVPETEFYSPEKTSNRYFGTPDLWYLILFINNITSSIFYNKKEIYILNKDRLFDILDRYIKNSKKIKESNNTIELKDQTITMIL